MGDIWGEIGAQKNIQDILLIYKQDFDDIWSHISSLVPNQALWNTSKSASDWVSHGVKLG